MASGATCVQKLDGSRDSAIHTKYRILLRSSSMHEPRYPLPRVVCDYKEAKLHEHTANGTSWNEPFFNLNFLGTSRAGVLLRRGKDQEGPMGHQGHTSTVCHEDRTDARPSWHGCYNMFTGRSALQASTMILPQVHLRKPCYDFSFL